MSSRIEHNDEDQFANGQSSRDLQVRDASELAIQLIDAIYNVGDFLRFIAISPFRKRVRSRLARPSPISRGPCAGYSRARGTLSPPPGILCSMRGAAV
jgi:hypothetical protein